MSMWFCDWIADEGEGTEAGVLEGEGGEERDEEGSGEGFAAPADV